MSTAEIALCISIFSAVIASLSLGWNIYKELALRARVRVTLAVGKFVAEGMPPSEDHAFLEATNFGPGKIKLEMIWLQKSSLWLRLRKKTEHAALIYDYKNPRSAKLPTTLEVGERTMYPFPLDQDCFLANGFTHIGLRDSFGRMHWAPQKSVKEARGKWSMSHAEAHVGRKNPADRGNVSS